MTVNDIDRVHYDVDMAAGEHARELLGTIVPGMPTKRVKPSLRAR